MQKLQSLFRNGCIAVVGGLGSVSAFADVDVAGAVSAVEDAGDKGGSVGTAVIAVVAGLVVVGVIIAIVKKI